MGWRTVLFLIFLIGSILYIYSYPQNESTPIEVRPVLSKPKALSYVANQNSTSDIIKDVPVPIPKTLSLPPLDQNQSNLLQNKVTFELDKNSLAIAFGDIVLGKPLADVPNGRGVAVAPELKLWPTREIPFHIQANFPNPERVYAALDNFENTPILFVPYTDQTDALVFEASDEHCKSYLGKTGGLQPIWLSDNCQPQQITHEIMHALGFVHEHSRTDRDEFVEVLWDNIDEGYKHQFALVPEKLMVALKNTPFDFQSVMIYRPEFFARKPGDITLRALDKTQIAPSDGLSSLDISRVNKLFENK